MGKQKRKLIEKLLFEVYDKGLQMQDCNLTDYYEKILQALNKPCVIKSVCVHPYEKVYQSETECYCEICGHDFTEQTVL